MIIFVNNAEELKSWTWCLISIQWKISTKELINQTSCFLFHDLDSFHSLQSPRKISITIYDVSSYESKKEKRKKRNFRCQCVPIVVCSLYEWHSPRELYRMGSIPSRLSPLPHGFHDNRLYPPLNTQDVSFKNINASFAKTTSHEKKLYRLRLVAFLF